MEMPMPTPKAFPVDMSFTSAPGFSEMSKTMNVWTAAWVDGVTRWYGDGARFVSERLERDRATLERLAVCKTFADFAEVQQHWAGQAAEDYARESRRLFEIAFESTSLFSSHRHEKDRSRA
jgi:hypothetical protein